MEGIRREVRHDEGQRLVRADSGSQQDRRNRLCVTGCGRRRQRWSRRIERGPCRLDRNLRPSCEAVNREEGNWCSGGYWFVVCGHCFVVRVNHLSSTTNHVPPISHHQPRITNHHPRTTSHQPPISYSAAFCASARMTS